MEKQYDLVVIGGGGSGMSAALNAWENGLRSIVVLEKRAAPGGNSAIPSPPVKNGVPDHLPPGEVWVDVPPEEKAVTDYEKMAAWTHCRCNTGVIRALSERQQETCDWLAEKLGDNDIPERRQGGTAKLLLSWCRRREIEIITKANVTALKQDDTGAVIGVECIMDGEPLNIRCKAVVLATGGFLGNVELMKKYFAFCDMDGDLDDMFCYMSFRHEGGGVQLAERAGASRDSVSIEFGTLRYPVKNGGVAYLANAHYFPQPIWVNPFGMRFVNECADQALNAALSLPRLRSYCLFDRKTFEQMRVTGIQRNIGGKDTFLTLEEDFEKDSRRGDCKCCETISEAAAFIGCDSAALQNTIDRYNGFCSDGADRDFGRKPELLVPVQTAPYYVMRLRLAPLLTHGPVHVNETMQVVGKNGSVIPGLYCVGADMGGIDVEIYNVTVLGHSMRWAVTSGRIAGEHAAKTIQNQ